MTKNIVIVVSSMNIGGTQSVVSRLCNHWSEDGYVVTLIHTFSGEKINYYPLHKNVTLKYLRISPFSSKNKVGNLVWKFIHLRKLIKASYPDVVISFLTRVNIGSMLATLGIEVPLVICERSWPPFLRLNNRFFWMYKILFKRVDKFVVQTVESKTWLHQNMPNKNIKVIPNPIVYPLPANNEQSVHPDSVVSPNKKVILASGRLHKYKQFDLLIRAFSRIADMYPDWDLVILGNGEESTFLHRLSFELKIEDRVNFQGSVGNMAEWYERADLFVLSSLLEGFPNVLLEAMCYGLPCISFDCNTGPRDMIKDGFNGILVNPDDREFGLVNALEKLISNEELRSEFSCNSIHLRDKYSISNVMQKWDSVLYQ